MRIIMGNKSSVDLTLSIISNIIIKDVDSLLIEEVRSGAIKIIASQPVNCTITNNKLIIKPRTCFSKMFFNKYYYYQWVLNINIDIFYLSVKNSLNVTFNNNLLNSSIFYDIDKQSNVYVVNDNIIYPFQYYIFSSE